MHILIAGKSEKSAQFIANVLKHTHSNGYVFNYATTKQEILDLLEHGYTPDVMISELDLPDPDQGFDLLKELNDKNRYSFPKIAVVSGGDNGWTTKLQDECGVTEVILKPLNGQHLLRTITTAVTIFEKERDIVLVQMNALDVIAHMAEAKEGLSAMHIDSVGLYCEQTAKCLGLGAKEYIDIGYAAKLHDIGKMRIPEGILNQPRKLTNEEFERVKSHTWLGLDVFALNRWVPVMSPIISVASEIIHFHHENYNGSGYPQGLAGNGIPLPARICRVADTFDALVSARPYKNIWPIHKAVAHLNEEKGRLFDPDVVKAFIDVIGESVTMQ